MVAFHGELETEGIEKRVDNDEVLDIFYAFERFVNLNGGSRAYYDKVMSRLAGMRRDGGLMTVIETIENPRLSWRRIMDFMIVTNLTGSWKDFFDVRPKLKSWDDWIRENGGWKAMREFVGSETKKRRKNKTTG